VSVGTIFEWLQRLSGTVGLPGVLVYLFFYRRRVRAAGRGMEAQAEVAEQTVPIAIKTSSVTQLEAELAALAASFREDRQIKGDTIEWLSQQLKAERDSSGEKDDKIRELERKVGHLQTRVRDLTDELGRVADDLAELHKPHDPPPKPPT
jgi:septal ring factor EnvC (AmiA/AmiB activator)